MLGVGYTLSLPTFYLAPILRCKMARAATRRTASKTPRRNGKKSNATRKRKEKAMKLIGALVGTGIGIAGIYGLLHKYTRRNRNKSKVDAENQPVDAENQPVPTPIEVSTDFLYNAQAIESAKNKRYEISGHDAHIKECLSKKRTKTIDEWKKNNCDKAIVIAQKNLKRELQERKRELMKKNKSKFRRLDKDAPPFIPTKYKKV